MKRYTLSESVKKMLESREERTLACDRCHEPFKVGDRIVSKKCKWNKLKRYHGHCKESMFV